MAEIKIILYKSTTVRTRKLGNLEFAVLVPGAVSKTGKSIDKFPSDRDLFVQVLYDLMKEPRKSTSNLASLSDGALRRIGKELLSKSLLADRYDRLGKRKGNFFTKFKIVLTALI